MRNPNPVIIGESYDQHSREIILLVCRDHQAKKVRIPEHASSLEIVSAIQKAFPDPRPPRYRAAERHNRKMKGRYA